MVSESGRNFKAIAYDISEGFVTVNPLFLKPFDEKNLKSLYRAIERKQSEIRAEPFPYNDSILIRQRNIKLQRLYAALIVLKNFAREAKLAINL
ncbi:MAG: hypothetical protein QMD01_02380 [Thermodesulfovibrionales bacterium]|nr:hypothetical protein [Thermodesulfovibrionales bacterium]